MRVFRYRLAWAIVAGVLTYVAMAYVVPLKARGDALRAVFLVLSGWALFAYWRPFRRALGTEGWPSGELLYAVMIWLVAAATNLNVSIGLFWRLAGQPAFLINNAVFDFWVVLGCAALLIAITVPDLFGKDVPPRDRLQLGGVWTIMVLLVAYLVLVRPDLDWLADLARPYLGQTYEYDPN